VQRVCPTKPLSCPTAPQPGHTRRLPLHRTAVQRHAPPPLTPFDPVQTNSKLSLTPSPFSGQTSTSRISGFSPPNGETSLAAASPAYYRAATSAPSSAERVYTTATALSTESRRTRPDNHDATLHGPHWTRFVGHRSVLRQHDRPHVLSRDSTSLLNRARVRPFAATRPIFAPVPGAATAARQAPGYRAATLHLYRRRYTSPLRPKIFPARSTPLLLHLPPTRETIAADNASNLAKIFIHRENYRTYSLTRTAYATGHAQHLRAPDVLYAAHADTNLPTDLVPYTRKPTRLLRLGQSHLVPWQQAHTRAPTLFSPTPGLTANARLYSHNARPTPEPDPGVKMATFCPAHTRSFRRYRLPRHVGLPGIIGLLACFCVRHPPRHYTYTP
jgi:hypothetical protein